MWPLRSSGPSHCLGLVSLTKALSCGVCPPAFRQREERRRAGTAWKRHTSLCSPLWAEAEPPTGLLVGKAEK